MAASCSPGTPAAGCPLCAGRSGPGAVTSAQSKERCSVLGRNPRNAEPGGDSGWHEGVTSAPALHADPCQASGGSLGVTFSGAPEGVVGLGVAALPCRWLCRDMAPLGIRDCPRSDWSWCQLGAGSPGPAPQPWPGPKSLFSSELICLADVSSNMASWPEKNQLGHLANVYVFFIAGFCARRGTRSGAAPALGPDGAVAPARPRSATGTLLPLGPA